MVPCLSSTLTQWVPLQHLSGKRLRTKIPGISNWPGTGKSSDHQRRLLRNKTKFTRFQQKTVNLGSTLDVLFTETTSSSHNTLYIVPVDIGLFYILPFPTVTLTLVILPVPRIRYTSLIVWVSGSSHSHVLLKLVDSLSRRLHDGPSSTPSVKTSTLPHSVWWLWTYGELPQT